VLLWLYLDAEVLVLPPPVLSSGLFLLAADLRRHPTPAHPCPVASGVLVWPVPRGVSVIPRAVSLRVSISPSTGILGIPLTALLSNMSVPPVVALRLRLLRLWLSASFYVSI